VRLGNKTLDAAIISILSIVQKALPTCSEGTRLQILSDSSPRVTTSQPWFLLLIELAHMPERSSGHSVLP
jgi:hypothetical protein